MNKKLFSWKALAGLALLVAMGLTSCKQGTEIDPENPTSKPVKPGTSTAGDADLTFTITNAKGGDLTTLWNTWKKNNADDAEELMAQDEITIALDFTNYKLDGTAISVPNFFAKKDGKILNLLISNFAEAKKALNLDVAANLGGVEVNMYLPAAEFEMVLDAQGTKTTLDSEEGTILTTFTGTADDVKKNALTIEDAVVVAGIDMDGALVASTDNILAKLISGDVTLAEGKGAEVGVKDVAAVYVKNLIVTSNATISGTDKTALESITIAKKVRATIAGKKPQVETIVGLGDFSKDEQSFVKFTGDENSFTNIESIANAEIEGVASDIKDMSIFTGVVFDMDVNVYTDIADTELLGNVEVKVGDDVEEITFSNVNFGSKTKMTFTGATKVTGKSTSIIMYQWDKAKKNYVVLADEKDLYETNTEYVEIVQSVSKKTPKALGLTMSDGKFIYDNYNDAKDDLAEAQAAYEAKIKEVGQAKANTTTGDDDTNYTKELKAYQAAWEVIYGDAKAFNIYKKNDKGQYLDEKNNVTTAANKVAIKVSFEAMYKDDEAGNTGIVAEEAYKYMNAVNPQIGDADWFEIVYAKEKYVAPEDVIISFDEDCTIGDAAITLKKLNNMIVVTNKQFDSKDDIWFDIVNDEVTYKWAYDSDEQVYYLK